jgi:hypothetical protein
LQLINDIDIYYLEFVSAVRIYEADLNKWRFFLKSTEMLHPYSERVKAKYKCIRCRRFLFLMYAAHCASLKIPM